MVRTGVGRADMSGGGNGACDSKLANAADVKFQPAASAAEGAGVGAGRQAREHSRIYGAAGRLSGSSDRVSAGSLCGSLHSCAPAAAEPNCLRQNAENHKGACDFHRSHRGDGHAADLDSTKPLRGCLLRSVGRDCPSLSTSVTKAHDEWYWSHPFTERSVRVRSANAGVTGKRVETGGGEAGFSLWAK